MEVSQNEFKLIGNSLLYIIPIAGLIGLIVPLALDEHNLFILGLYAAIPMVLVSLAYLVYSRNTFSIIALDGSKFKSLLLIYTILYVAAVIALIYSDVRPHLYYLIVAFAALTILLEITLFNISKTRAWVIIAQIMAFSLNIIWGVNLKYYFYLGRTDPLAHTWLIDNLLMQGRVTDVFEVYKPFPLWHILISYLQMLTGISIPSQKLMFFTNGLVYIAILLVIYLVMQKLVNNQRIALLSILFLSVYPFYLGMGMSSISRDVVPIFLLTIILLWLDKYSTRKFYLAIFLTLTIIIYHTVSILFVLIILFMLFLSRHVCGQGKERSILSLKYFAIAITMFVVYWGLFANLLVSQVMSNLLSAAPAGIMTQSVIYTPLSEVANYIQYSFLLFFIITGIILIFRSDSLGYLPKAVCIVALILIPLMFPGPVQLINKLAENFNIDRFSEYGFIFIALTASYGFWEMFYRSKKYMKGALVVLFTILVLLSVSNDFVASDNPLIKRPFYTYYLTEGEVDDIGHIFDKTNGLVMSDYVAVRYMMNSPYKSKSNILEIDGENLTLLRNNSSDVILIREGEFNKRPLKLLTFPDNNFKLNPPWNQLDYYYNDSAINDGIGKLNRVYDSKEVYGLN